MPVPTVTKAFLNHHQEEQDPDPTGKVNSEFSIPPEKKDANPK
jgi:hypothetical protein